MSRWLEGLKGRLEVMKTLFRFLWEQRLWWMIPMVAVLLFLGLLLLIAQQSALGPFIYTLF